ncbi:MAG: hypothetical protein BWK77_02700 [Verrucomicrobia bacterium A1]|nr:MAG: hypothetical protein BWK77_02700 [Verrucomicrobia bacterium A1]
MKTAISISDPVFLEAEAYAKRHGISRSSLYTEAVKAFVEHRRPADVTRQLDEIYAREAGELDVVLGRMQASSLPKETW